MKKKIEFSKESHFEKEFEESKKVNLKKKSKKITFRYFRKKSHFEKRKKIVPELKIVDLPIHELCTTQNDLQNRIHQSS